MHVRCKGVMCLVSHKYVTTLRTTVAELVLSTIDSAGDRKSTDSEEAQRTPTQEPKTCFFSQKA